MANTKRRTNISLDTKLFKEATAYGKENGISLSALIEQGLRLRLSGPAVMAEHTNLAPLPDIDALGGTRIEEHLPQILMAWLESARGAERLERILVPYVNERVALLKGRAAAPDPATGTPTPTADAPTPTPKASSRPRQSTVDMPPEVLARLQRFTVPQLVEATGMDRSNVSRYRSGNRSRVSELTYDKLLAGLEKLEERE